MDSRSSCTAMTTPLQVREAEVRVEVLPEPRFARVTGVVADTVVAPGGMLAVKTSLRVGRRSDREIDLTP